jgi:putative endonuclease
MSRKEAEKQGRRAEGLAALWLRLKGWRVAARRVRTPVGEIDLIVRRGRMVAFVEVKARGTADGAGLALDQHRLKRVAAAAQAVAPRFVKPGEDMRIDAVFVVPGRWPTHLENVWHG